MDWNKAKTILIIGFIVIDIFLIIQIFSAKDKTETFGVNEQVIQILADKGIKIETDIKPEYKSLPLLEVEYEIYDSDSAEIENYLGKDYIEIVSEEYFNNSQGASIQIEKGKKLIFQLRKSVIWENVNTEIAIKKVEEFIENFNIDINEYSLTNSYIENSLFYVVYTKKYNGYSLENSYYTFVIDENGIVGFEQQKIKTIKENRGAIQITKSDEALLRLLKYKDVYNDTIIGMEICYYRDESINNEAILVVDNLEPTWKVSFNSGIIKYLIEME